MIGELHLAFRLRDPELRSLVERWCARAPRHRPLKVIEHGDRRPALPDGRAWQVLLCSRGECWSTEDVAAKWRRAEEAAVPVARFLIGGPDGWPGDAGSEPRWSFGRITLPHALAAAVLAEQLYRVGTILDGHPYHLGHGGGA